MPRKKTHEEYVQQVHQKAPHIQVRGKYDGNRTPIEHYCLKHNIAWDAVPFSILQHPTGCPECVNEIMNKHYEGKRKTDEQFRQEVNDLGIGIKPMSEYKGTHTKMPFECAKGHLWYSTPHDVLDGYGCPYCAGNAVLKGYNDLWTTNPDMAKMLKDPNLGYEISRSSHRKVEWVCPNCGMEKISTPKQVSTYGLACSRCSDGISYPNRFIIALLQCLNIDIFYPEWSPEWIKPYRYDVYFIYNNKEYIVEMDGGIGHGGIDFETKNRDVKGLERDVIKDKQAQLHNIFVIRIDCRYELKGMNSRFEYIKQSILNSQLSQIFDLSNIDWGQCNKEATKSLHMLASRKYDEGIGIREIPEMLHVHYGTVYNWLKRMSSEGLCSYKPILGTPSHQKNRNTLNIDMDA